MLAAQLKPTSRQRSARSGASSRRIATTETMPTANLDWEKIGSDEKSRMKEWQSRRARELADLSIELQHASAVCPIGRDRTYRRFWVFRSLPGLFVEDHDDCVPEEVFAGCVAAEGVDSEKDKGASFSGGSDKENDEGRGESLTADKNEVDRFGGVGPSRGFISAREAGGGEGEDAMGVLQHPGRARGPPGGPERTGAPRGAPEGGVDGTEAAVAGVGGAVRRGALAGGRGAVQPPVVMPGGG